MLRGLGQVLLRTLQVHVQADGVGDHAASPICLAMAVAALLLWIFADKFINATMVAIVIFVVMLLSRIITWDDVLEYRQAWNMLIWFGTLVALADGLKIVGFLKWFAGSTSAMLEGLPITVIVVAMVAVFATTALSA